MYIFLNISSAYLLFTPIIILEAFKVSSTAVPCDKNSGFDATSTDILLFNFSLIYFSILLHVPIGTVDFTTTNVSLFIVLAILSHASNKYYKFAEPSSLSGVPTANIITSASLYAYL